MGLNRFMIGPDGKENVPHIEWLRAFKRVVDRFKEEMEDFVDAKVPRDFNIHDHYTEHS